MKQIPTNHAYTQPNTSDVIGDIFISKNLDLTDNLGKVRVGKRLVVSANSIDFNTIDGVPVAIKEFNINLGNRIISVAGSKLLQSSTDYPGGGTVVFIGSSPTDLTSLNSDLEIYNGDLHITGATNLYKLAFGGTNVGSSLYSSLSSSFVHIMCAYAGNLYITNGTTIVKWDGSSGTTAFTLPITSTKQTITSIRAASNRIWVCTAANINSAGQRGYVYEWDGASASASKEHRLDSAGVVSCVIKDDIPYIMDVYGRLLAWNGGTFKEMARLNRRRNQLFNTAYSGSSNGYVHPNGMTIVNGRINILINGSLFDSAGTMLETIPSGVWEYDENIGLYHKHSFGLSHANDTITDYGANRVSAVGALSEVNYPDNSSSRDGTFMAGADYYSDATTTVHGLFYDNSNDTLQKYGILVGTKIEATDGTVYNLPTVEAMWESWFTIYKKLLNSTDKIVGKYRLQEGTTVEGVITWIDNQTFSVPNSSVVVSNYLGSNQPLFMGGAGSEIEIMQGLGAGKCAHITSASLNGSSLWVVTVDEAFTNGTLNGTSVARFSNWKKISAIAPNNQSFNSDTIGTKSQWIQFKVCMQFTGRDEIERFILSNSNATLPK